MSVTSSSEGLYKTKEAATYLGISTRTVRELAHRGKIPIIRLHPKSTSWLFRKTDLEKLVQDHTERL